ncbi:MAG TPA: beta-N-acetylhexosaminidase [Bacillota bacterium]|nr:beta-N-acetylhexosaminidase [Bacillota bacterium]HOK68294.1 beta-N-acetylhexosaminidase [Bacillota bacterium]HPP84508.1 beta-N-acetylhexosaminidase [Bacillota bacterium]
MRKITLSGDIEGLMAGFEEIKADLGLENADSGLPVAVKKGACLKVSLKDNSAQIEYAEPVHFFRALSLLTLNLNKGSTCFEIKEEPGFRKNGVMFDCSRNAVLTVDTLKFFFRKMALMGLNLGMMYTEDTYEVPEYPYFGYMRGRYTFDEIREADDYANMFGIELVPCIQTLAHLNRATHWPKMWYLKDTDEVLLVGADSTYEFIENILKAATAPYRTKRVHIGMDEAMDLGLGNYLRKNGYVPSSEIMKYHLKRVHEILKKLGLKAMMWSDMYFRVVSPSHSYYDLQHPVTQDIVDSAPEDIDLVYWDYYNSSDEVLTGMIAQHQRFKADTIFAGGIWTWAGPAADYRVTLTTTLPALKKCREMGVKEVFATAWGDNGAEANFLTTLYGLQMYAEIDYTGAYNPEEVAERFKVTTGGDANSFLDLSAFNLAPGMPPLSSCSNFLAKYMLYQDPIMPLCEADVKKYDLAAHYGSLEEKYAKYAAESKGELKLLFEFYTSLAKTLKIKCGWHKRSSECVRAKDYEQAKKVADEVADVISALRELKSIWYRLWNATNKPYGFEIIDIRLGGLISRFETAQMRLYQFANKEVDDIPELSTEKLLFASDENGNTIGYRTWQDLISACKI